jgi:hypothetical protein
MSNKTDNLLEQLEELHPSFVESLNEDLSFEMLSACKRDLHKSRVGFTEEEFSKSEFNEIWEILDQLTSDLVDVIASKRGE